ncbi:hypothetical protein ACTWP4_09600 [Gracilibacillus sp. D59]|uniref:hypothetical protein n=1 Tax=Gracilibacillus sp. D59 TaxID=3457434 RepID=UPI003FCCBAEB
MRKVSVILVVLLCLVCACNTDVKTVQIENKDFAKILFVQKIENNFTSEKLSKPIEDKEKIKKVLSMVEGLEAEEINTDELIRILEDQDNYYMFGFYKDDRTSLGRGDYGFQFLENGTILFSYDQPSTPSHPLITVNSHQDLLEEMKEILGITF